jgi:hypothetical protein
MFPGNGSNNGYSSASGSSPLFTDSCTELSLSFYITTDGQSASLSWYQAPIWGLWPDFYYCLTIAGFWYGAPSLTRGRVSFTMYNTFYCLRFETPPTWRTRSLYLYPPGTGWPGYTPRPWVTLSLTNSPLTELSTKHFHCCSPTMALLKICYLTMGTCLPSSCPETVLSLQPIAARSLHSNGCTR